MNLPAIANALPDTQAQSDARGIAISQAGVAGYSLPLRIEDVDGQACATIARVAASVGLSRSIRGAHMSRFPVFLNRLGGELQLSLLTAHARTVARELGALEGHLEMDFPWFITKTAPRSGIQGLLDVEASYRANATVDGASSLEQEVRVPATSLCPCSRAISRYGAHNQRCIVTIRVTTDRPVPLQTMVATVERNASCELYPVLKREDEKFVTEKAYENAKFVEDIVRDIALELDRIPAITCFSVSCESIESIHNHQAFATATSTGMERSVKEAR